MRYNPHIVIEGVASRLRHGHHGRVQLLHGEIWEFTSVRSALVEARARYLGKNFWSEFSFELITTMVTAPTFAAKNRNAGIARGKKGLRASSRRSPRASVLWQADDDQHTKLLPPCRDYHHGGQKF